MRIGAFEVTGGLPELREPHAFAALRPWVDVGNVGTGTLLRLQEALGAEPLARLKRPGVFYDYTRYRPTIHTVDGRRELSLPNSFVNYARGPNDNDFLFLHLLEPHMGAESYINSILQLLKRLGVRRYCLLGAMYDVVPHTRPLIITGSAQGAATEETVRRMGIEASSYEGPTTITVLISQTAPEMGIETMSAIVHLPQYAQVDEDYTGALRLLQILSSMYGLPINLSQLENDSERQRAEITEATERNPQLRHMIRQIETHYEARVKKDIDSSPGLSPEVEKFLRELGKRMEGE